MKPLLDLNSTTYKRRLVRELNGLIDGFYAPFPNKAGAARCHRAQFHAGNIEVRIINSPTNYWSPIQNEHLTCIVDAYGRDVVASRIV